MGNSTNSCVGRVTKSMHKSLFQKWKIKLGGRTAEEAQNSPGRTIKVVCVCVHACLRVWRGESERKRERQRERERERRGWKITI